jgi:hypothetical protein
LTFSGSEGSSGPTLDTTNTPSLVGAGISTITFSSVVGPPATSPTSGLYSGSTANLNTSPFGGQAGSAPPSPTNNYLVAGDNAGTVTINWATQQTSLDLLWGTLDTGGSPGAENEAVTLVAGSQTITGATIANVIAAAGGPNPLTTGEFNVLVEITGLDSFSQLQASDNDSAHPAFEFDPLVVPAPPIGQGLAAVLAVCGGLFGFKLWERSKRRSPLKTVASHAAA